jgi:hypothetical protein
MGLRQPLRHLYGYQAVAAYLLYILRDYIGLADGASNIAVANMALLLMGAAMVAPLAAPSMAGMWVYAGVIGIGYGMKNFSVVS